jgi:hypothetical protein
MMSVTECDAAVPDAHHTLSQVPQLNLQIITVQGKQHNLKVRHVAAVQQLAGGKQQQGRQAKLRESHNLLVPPCAHALTRLSAL